MTPIRNPLDAAWHQGDFFMPYTCFCDRAIFSKKYIVSIEILFYLCYITFVINEITKYKSNGGIYDENCSCGIQWKGEPCDY